MFHERKHLFAFQPIGPCSIKCLSRVLLRQLPVGKAVLLRFDLIVLKTETRPLTNPRLIELCRLIGSTWADPHGIILLDSSFLPSLSLSLCLFFRLARKFPSPVGEREYPAVSPSLNSSTIKKLTRFYHSEVC